MKKLLIFSILVIFALTACGARSDETSPEMAQSLLKARGYNYSEEEFFKAISQNDAGSVNLFLQGGMDGNIKNKTGETALVYAILKSNVEVLKVLANKSNLNAIDTQESMPLFIALKNERIENFKYLLEKGADPNSYGTSANASKQTVLYRAVILEKPEYVKSLLEKGANPDLVDNAGSTPLTEVTVNNSPDLEIFRMLSEKTKNINVQDQSGTTALMYIAKNNRVQKSDQAEMIKALLGKGADKTIKDKDGKTALDWAKSRGNKEAVELLK